MKNYVYKQSYMYKQECWRAGSLTFLYKQFLIRLKTIPADIYLFQVNNRKLEQIKDWKQPFRRVPWIRCSLQKESLNDSEGVYYLVNLQVKSLPLWKPMSSFENTFPDFPKTITFFMFLKFCSSYFRG